MPLQGVHYSNQVEAEAGPCQVAEDPLAVGIEDGLDSSAPIAESFEVAIEIGSYAVWECLAVETAELDHLVTLRSAVP